MANWKVQKLKKKETIYMHFKEGVPKKLTVGDWDFSRGHSYLFRCYVTQEDGLPVDKIWTVWDYDSMRLLKKKLGIKSVGNKVLTVTMRKIDDESTFEVA
jgi:hypothetical protein